MKQIKNCFVIKLIWLTKIHVTRLLSPHLNTPDFHIVKIQIPLGNFILS